MFIGARTEMFYFLVIFSCVGADCHKEAVGDGFAMTNCLVQSQQIAAEWKETHPNRVIHKLRCVPLKRLVSELNRDWS